MRRPPFWRLLAAAAVGIGLAGCGIPDPYAAKQPAATTSSTSSTIQTTATDADPAPERGGTIPAGAAASQDRVAGGAATPQAALERYARLYVSWTASTVADVQEELASISTGQARAQALQAATSYGHDQTLIQSGVANSGHLIALSQDLAEPGQWVLVTSERTTGRGDYAGLPSTMHVTYAQVTPTRSGWVVSEWSPQN
jgi:hypothetical protein